MSLMRLGSVYLIFFFVFFFSAQAIANPNVTAPEEDTGYRSDNDVTITYTLDTAPQAGTVQIVWEGDSTITWTMADSQSVSFTYDITTDPALLAEVASATSSLLPEDTYDVTVRYNEDVGGALQTVTLTSVKIADACIQGEFSDDGLAPCTECPAGRISTVQESTECTLCIPGTFQSLPGEMTCTQCTAGTFQANFGSIDCDPCIAGTFSADDSAIACEECAAGKTSEEGQNTCTDCSVGSFSDEDGSSSCSACEAGTFQADEGAIECDTCPAGTYSEDGDGACTTCPAGTFSEAGSSECTECDAGSFSGSAGSTTCTSCPSGLTSEAGASECDISLCGNGDLDDDESCDDGNTDDLDGCSSTCETEEYSSLEELNSDIDFDDLSVGQTITVRAVEEESSSSLKTGMAFQTESDCTCSWTVTPEELAALDDDESCAPEVTLVEEGTGNMQVEVDCGEEETLNQSFLVSEASESSTGSSSSSSSGCQLSMNQDSFVLGRFFLLIIGLFLVLSLRVKVMTNQSHK